MQTFWLISENKQKRLRRLESVYSDSVTAGFSVSNCGTIEDNPEGLITFKASPEATKINKSLESRDDDKRICDALIQDTYSEEHNFRLSKSENMQIGKQTGPQDKHMNGGTVVEMSPLLVQVKKESKAPINVNMQ